MNYVYSLLLLMTVFIPSLHAAKAPTNDDIREMFFQLLSSKENKVDKAFRYHEEDIRKSNLSINNVVIPLYKIDFERREITPTYPSKFWAIIKVSSDGYYFMAFQNAHGKWMAEALSAGKEETYNTYKNGKEGYWCTYFDKDNHNTAQTWISNAEVVKDGYKVIDN